MILTCVAHSSSFPHRPNFCPPVPSSILFSASRLYATDMITGKCLPRPLWWLLLSAQHALFN